MKEIWLQTGEIKTRVHLLGDDRSPVIVCLHGLGGTGLSFLELAELLTDDYRLALVTIPGSANSEGFPRAHQYRMAELTEWLHQVLVQLGFNELNLLGHSWGAQIGLFYLNRFAEKVAKCVLIDGGYYKRSVTHSASLSVDQEIAEIVLSDNAYRFETLDAYLAAERRDVEGWNAAKQLAAMDRAVRQGNGTRWHVSNTVTEWALKGIYKYEPFTIYDELKSKQLGSKIQLLQATVPETRTDRALLAEEFRIKTGGSVIPMNGCGHNMHSSSPREVAAQVRRFLDRSSNT